MVKCFSITNQDVIDKIAAQRNQSAYISRLVEEDIKGEKLIEEIKKLLANATISNSTQNTIDTSSIMDILKM